MLNLSLSLSLSDSYCVQVVRLCASVAAAALMFPLLTWGGYKLLPFDAPRLDSTPLRLVYTLRCAFFASIPIILGEDRLNVMVLKGSKAAFIFT